MKKQPIEETLYFKFLKKFGDIPVLGLSLELARLFDILDEVQYSKTEEMPIDLSRLWKYLKELDGEEVPNEA